MRFVPAIAALAVAFGFAADDVRAATISIIDSNQGTVEKVEPGRADPTEALVVDGTFFSLGLSDLGDAGFIAYNVSPTSNVEFSITEVTNRCSGMPGCDDHFEQADIYVGGFGVYEGMGSTNGMTFLDTISNGEAQMGAVLSANNVSTILVIDSTPSGTSSSFDGFDVDGVNITSTPIPLPAAGWLLLGALTGVGILGRRRSA